MRIFKNSKTNEIATQINDTCWYQIIRDDPKMNYQLPIWCLNEPYEFGINYWKEIK